MKNDSNWIVIFASHEDCLEIHAQGIMDETAKIRVALDNVDKTQKRIYSFFVKAKCLLPKISVRGKMRNILALLALVIACLVFANYATAASHSRENPAKIEGLEKHERGRPTLRKPVPWEKTATNKSGLSSGAKGKLTTKNKAGENSRRLRAGGRNYLLFQTEPDKRHGTVKDAVKTYQQNTDINYNARQLDKGEYRNTYDPRNILEYRQYIRHHWSNSGRRPFDAHGPGSIFRQLK